MALQLILTGNTIEDLIRQAQIVVALKSNLAVEETAKEPKKTTKKPKEEPEEEFSLGEETMNMADHEEKKHFDLKKDVIPAIQKYAKENSREDAAKILKRFKVKSVHDLKPEDYSAVMEALS